MKKVFLIVLVVVTVFINAIAEDLYNTPPAEQISSNPVCASITWSNSTQKDEEGNFAIILDQCKSLWGDTVESTL